MPAEQPSLTASQRILIVEDLEDSRESLQELLTVALRAEVDAVEDGVRALELLAQHPYALVITDLRMPKASGMRILREVKDRRLSCAVVVVTGHGGVKEAVEAMRLGAYDFLTKPLDPQQFVLLVDRILRERAGRPDPGAADGDGAEETVPLFDAGDLTARPAPDA